VIRFVDDVLDYQYRYGVRLRVGTLIKSNVAQELVDRLEGLTLPILLIMPTRYIFKPFNWRSAQLLRMSSTTAWK